VTLIGNVNRIGYALCSKCKKLRVKYFFLADIIVKGMVVELDKYAFSLADIFHLVARLRLASSCI
jgi:hypothetical protein